MVRERWPAMLGTLVLLTAACEDEPAAGGGLFADAAGPAVTVDAAVGLDAQIPDGSLPGPDTAVVMPPADTGIIAPPPDAGGDATAAGPDTGLALPDAGVEDSAAPSDDASTPGFPPVSDPGAKGPYTAQTIENTGPDGNYTVYHPAELAPGGALNPIVSWGNGGFTAPQDYPLLPHLASHGFVVIASNNLFVTSGEVRSGTDWIVQQNETSTSPFHRKLDVANIAGVGYSLGGLATLEVADDPRYVTIVIISGASTTPEARATNTPKLRTPVAYLCTDDDASEDNCAGDFAVVTVPAFFGVMKGSTHFDVTTAYGVVGVPAILDRLNESTTAWLRWRQMGDVSFRARFVGSGCGLCMDSNWTVQQKNLQ